MAAAPLPSRVVVGDLEVRPREGLALAAGRALTLSVREFGLLVALVRRRGGIVRREDLFAEVWQRELRSGDRSIDVYVHKLRSKLETANPSVRFIHTHVGFGYRFDPEPCSQPFHTAITGRQQAVDRGGPASPESQNPQKENLP